MNERGKVYGEEKRKVKGEGVGKLGVRWMPCGKMVDAVREDGGCRGDGAES